LPAFAFGAADVDVVHDAQQPGADAVGLEIKRLPRPDGAEVRLLNQVLGPLRVARQSARDAKEGVELFQRELLELFTRRFQGKCFPRMRVPGRRWTLPRCRQKYPNPPASLGERPGHQPHSMFPALQNSPVWR
jgi:hypothetical protein